MSEPSMNELTPEFEGRYYSPKMQWWCMHMHLRDEGNRDWGFYFWPALGSLDEAWICALYTDDRVIDLTKVHLPLGTLAVGRDGVDVRFGSGNYLKGAFPHYHVRVEGTFEGKTYVLEVEAEARTDAFRAVKDIKGIDWLYVPRLVARGAIQVDGHAQAVTGYSYYERRRGRFWAPGIKLGIWESIPQASPEGLSIPLFYRVWRNDGSAQLQTLTFTTDGKSLVSFPDVDVDIHETHRFSGFEEVEHPMRFTVRAKGERGHAELEVVRSPHRLRMRNYFTEPDPGANAIGMYGTGRTRGTIVCDGNSHSIDADSFGSALFFTRMDSET